MSSPNQNQEPNEPSEPVAERKHSKSSKRRLGAAERAAQPKVKEVVANVCERLAQKCTPSGKQQLAALMIFDTNIRCREGEEELKIMYYWPPSAGINVKTRKLGWAEALIGFARTFSRDKPLETVRLEHTTEAYHECEPGVWLMLSLHNPIERHGETTVYRSDMVDDLCLHTIAQEVYSIYRLFNGPITERIARDGRDAVKEQISWWMAFYLARVDFSQLDLFDILRGLYFLPLDRNMFLRIQCFLNLVENSFPSIYATCFLYQDRLLWSGLEQNDILNMYKFLHYMGVLNSGDGAYSKFVAVSEANSEYSPFHAANMTGSGYVTGPEGLVEYKTPEYSPHPYLGGGEKAYLQVTLQASGCTCLFFIDPAKLPRSRDEQRTFFSSLHSFVVPQLEFLAPVIGVHMEQAAGNDSFKYYYFNAINRAVKSSFVNKTSAASDRVRHILNLMHRDFVRSDEGISEVMLRSSTDGWMVGKKSEEREFYVTFASRNETLILVHEKVRELSRSAFGNIFIDESFY